MNPGSVFANRYKIIRSLGEGGMANVYLVDDLKENRKVAIKTLRLDLQENPDFVRRFQREAQSASRLVHPNVVQVIDSGIFEDTQYLVMEYVEGIDLKDYIKKFSPIPYAQVVNIMEQILSAVSAAHNHGIVHRDLKPQNILINKDGQVKITDFGIAVTRSEFGMTQTNTVLGSVHYLSPEQIKGGIATNKSDIYALGVILFEMLSGNVPYEGENAVSIAMKHSTAEMPSIRNIDPNIPQALENVIIRATAKNPDNRYLTAEDMSNDLSTALSPSRSNEPKIPKFVDDKAATRAIPISELQSDAPSSTSAAAATTTTSSKNGKGKNKAKKPKPKNWKEWVKRYWMWIVLGLIGLGMAAFLFNMFGPQKITMDNLRNKTLKQAQTIIKQNDLEVGTVTKTTSTKIKEGRVISTDPKAGARLKKGTKVDIIVSNGRKKTRLENYVGDDYKSIIKTLRSQGFKIQKEERSSTTVPEGQIMEQDVTYNGKNVQAPIKVVPSKTTIKFVVSSGPKKLEVPNFSTEAQATSWANENEVTLNISREQSDKATGTVLKQNPAAGSKITQGNTISITVSAGDDRVTVPRFTSFEQAMNWGSENGIQIYVNRQSSQTIPDGGIISQSVASGSKISNSTTITITISTGPSY